MECGIDSHGIGDYDVGLRSKRFACHVRAKSRSARPSRFISRRKSSVSTPGTRTITLRGAKGKITTAVVSDEVKNFDQLKVGDQVDVLYKNALLVTAEKGSGADKGIRKRVDTSVYTPASGASGASGFESARQVEVLATVESINRKNGTITLRGPWRTDTFDIPHDVDTRNLKPGDTIHAVFVSAAAVEVNQKALRNKKRPGDYQAVFLFT